MNIQSALGCTEFILVGILSLRSSPSSPTSNDTMDIATKFARLYIAFAVTGFVHIGGEYMFLGKMGFGAFNFFALQAVGITLEKLVSVCYCYCNFFNQIPIPSNEKATNTNGHPKIVNGNFDPPTSVQAQPNSTENHRHLRPANEIPDLWIRCIGYIWVVVWFSWSASFMIDPMISTGMFFHPLLDLRTKSWFA